jgi:hypothetical protein
MCAGAGRATLAAFGRTAQAPKRATNLREWTRHDIDHRSAIYHRPQQ